MYIYDRCVLFGFCTCFRYVYSLLTLINNFRKSNLCSVSLSPTAGSFLLLIGAIQVCCNEVITGTNQIVDQLLIFALQAMK